jgi:hypothetical protein
MLSVAVFHRLPVPPDAPAPLASPPTVQRIETRGDVAQRTLGGHRDTLRLEEALAGRLWRMIALGHLCAVALLGSQFERGLEEVHEQPGRSIGNCSTRL